MSERITSTRNGHWLIFDNDRVVVGCHCGFEADQDSDCGWGDSVVNHMWCVAQARALREAADNLYWRDFDTFPAQWLRDQADAIEQP